MPAAKLGLGYDPRRIARFIRVFGAGGSPPPDSPPATYAEVVGATGGLRHWWRLGDTTTSVLDSRGANQGTYSGGPPLVAGLIAANTDGARGLAAAPREMRFVPCQDRATTAWPGGLALADRRGVTLQVRVDGQPWRALSIPVRG